MSHLYRLGVDLMAAIAVSLGLAENYFEDTFERDPHWAGYAGRVGLLKGVE